MRQLYLGMPTADQLSESATEDQKGSSMWITENVTEQTGKISSAKKQSHICRSTVRFLLALTFQHITHKVVNTDSYCLGQINSCWCFVPRALY